MVKVRQKKGDVKLFNINFILSPDPAGMGRH
jgi:hypothetical protein